jgi:ankyrin repeat protein
MPGRRLLALRRKNLEAIRYLLRKKPDLKAKEADGETALHVAARCDDSPEMMAALIRAGGDVNAQDNDADTPLFWRGSWRAWFD